MCQLQRNKISLLELSSVPTVVGLSLNANDVAVQVQVQERGFLSLLLKADFYQFYRT